MKGSGSVYPVKTKMPIFKVYHTRMCQIGRNMWRRWVLEIGVLKDLDNHIILGRKGVGSSFNNRLILCVLRYEGSKGDPAGVETVERISQSALAGWMKRLQDKLPIQLEEVPDSQYNKEGDEGKEGKAEPDADAVLTEITKAYVGPGKGKQSETEPPREETGEEDPLAELNDEEPES